MKYYKFREYIQGDIIIISRFEVNMLKKIQISKYMFRLL